MKERLHLLKMILGVYCICLPGKEIQNYHNEIHLGITCYFVRRVVNFYNNDQTTIAVTALQHLAQIGGGLKNKGKQKAWGMLGKDVTCRELK